MVSLYQILFHSFYLLILLYIQDFTLCLRSDSLRRFILKIERLVIMITMAKPCVISSYFSVETFRRIFLVANLFSLLWISMAEAAVRASREEQPSSPVSPSNRLELVACYGEVQTHYCQRLGTSKVSNAVCHGRKV